MSFTGKATYSSGATLPEITEDVSDVISIISPFETPLLDVLGDPMRSATSTHHEWLEDTLLPNTDTIDDGSIMDGETETAFDVANGDRFLAGDQIQVVGSKELMLVTDVSSDTLMCCERSGRTATVQSIRLWSAASRSVRSMRSCRRCGATARAIRPIATV